MPQVPPAVPCLPWVARENERLLAILGGLGEADWKRPSYCPGWTAAHVIGHMTLGAGFYGEVIESGLGGEVKPPFGAKDVAEFREKRISWMEELVALDGAGRIARFAEAVERLQATFGKITPDNRDKPAWHPRCPTPVGMFPGQRLYELLFHEWDIRNAPDEDLHPDALGPAVDILKDRLVFFFNQSADPAPAGTFGFETSRPESAWAMAIAGGAASRAETAPAECDVRFIAPASDLLLLHGGRADAAAKEAAGRLRIEGDRERAEALMGALFRPY